MTDLMDAQEASERPRMDPRFARRWIDARRQEGRRRLVVVGVASGLAALVVLAVGSIYSPLFHVRHLRVDVTGPVSAAQVTQLAGVSRHSLMVDVHASSIAARLDADPWLGGARVERKWPGTVTVSVAARTALAVAATSDGRWAQIDATGRVLDVVATRPLGFPVLQGLARVPGAGDWLEGTSGPGPSPAEGPAALVDMAAASDGPDVPQGPAAVLAVLDSLPPVLRAAVLTAQVNPGPGLTLVVSPPRMASGTVTVLLGDGSQLEQKVSAFLTVMAQANLNGVTGLDLSVPARPALETGNPPFPPLPTPHPASSSTSNPKSGPGAASSTATTVASPATTATGPSTTGPSTTRPSTTAPSTMGPAAGAAPATTAATTPTASPAGAKTAPSTTVGSATGGG
jgi:hypothetical protein